MKKPKFLKRPSVLAVVSVVSLVFVAFLLISSAVAQFTVGHWFSGCVSILGVLLVIVAGLLLIPDMKKKEEPTHE